MIVNQCIGEGCMQSATFVCSCRRPAPLLCQTHIVYHTRSGGNHAFQPLFAQLTPNQYQEVLTALPLIDKALHTTLQIELNRMSHAVNSLQQQIRQIHQTYSHNISLITQEARHYRSRLQQMLALGHDTRHGPFKVAVWLTSEPSQLSIILNKAYISNSLGEAKTTSESQSFVSNEFWANDIENRSYSLAVSAPQQFFSTSDSASRRQPNVANSRFQDASDFFRQRKSEIVGGFGKIGRSLAGQRREPHGAARVRSLKQAREQILENIAIFRERQLPEDLMTALNELAVVTMQQKDYDATYATLHECTQLARQFQNSAELARSLKHFATLLRILKQPDEARRYEQELAQLQY